MKKHPKQKSKKRSKKKKSKRRIPLNTLIFSRENIKFLPKNTFDQNFFSTKRTNNNLLNSIYNNKYNENNNFMVNFFLNKISKKKG